MRVKSEDLLKIFVLFLGDCPLEFLYFLIRQQSHGTIANGLIFIHLTIRRTIIKTNLVTFGRLSTAHQPWYLALMTAAAGRLLAWKHDFLRLISLPVLCVDDHVCGIRFIIEDVASVWTNSYFFLSIYNIEFFFGLVIFVIGHDHVFDFSIRIKLFLSDYGATVLFGYFQLYFGVMPINLVLYNVQLLLEHGHLIFQFSGVLDRRSLNFVKNTLDICSIILK